MAGVKSFRSKTRHGGRWWRNVYRWYDGEKWANDWDPWSRITRPKSMYFGERNGGKWTRVSLVSGLAFEPERINTKTSTPRGKNVCTRKSVFPCTMGIAIPKRIRVIGSRSWTNSIPNATRNCVLYTTICFLSLFFFFRVRLFKKWKVTIINCNMIRNWEHFPWLFTFLRIMRDERVDVYLLIKIIYDKWNRSYILEIEHTLKVAWHASYWLIKGPEIFFR